MVQKLVLPLLFHLNGLILHRFRLGGELEVNSQFVFPMNIRYRYAKQCHNFVHVFLFFEIECFLKLSNLNIHCDNVDNHIHHVPTFSYIYTSNELFNFVNILHKKCKIIGECKINTFTYVQNMFDP